MSIEDYYDRMDELEKERQKAEYESIIKSFENLSLEEKVDRLIKIYASKKSTQTTKSVF